MPMSDHSPELQLEVKKWEAEKALRERALNLQELEIKARMEEQRRSRWSNPLVLAVLAAALAGVSNAVVTWMTGQNQIKVELEKSKLEIEVEESKAELTRILEAVKNSDPDKASNNLRFLAETMLIKNQTVRESILNYVKNRPGGESIFVQERIGTPDGNLIRYESSWLSGGHNQKEICNNATQELMQRYPGKTLSIFDTDEAYRKDLLGHVTYKYFCIFKIN